MAASYALATVCRVLHAPRSTVYHRRAKGDEYRRPGPKADISDEQLLRAIRLVLESSPFCGEGYRKVRARLRREQGIHTGGKRVLRLMRRAGLLAPQRARRRRTPRPHDGTIIPTGPNLRWGADGTMAYTRDDGWVWVFVCVDHFTAEAWAHVSASGDRHAALQPVYDAVVERWGELRADIGRGLALRHDWGPQYRSAHFLGSLRWLGIADDASYVGEPECNGCAEGGSRPSRSSACGPGSTRMSTTSAGRCRPSSRPTTTSGSSSATDTRPQGRRTSPASAPRRRDSHGNCPTDRGLNRWMLPTAPAARSNQ